MLQNELSVGVAQLPAQFGRNARPKRSRRHDGMFRHHRPGGHNRSFADAAVIQDSDPDADQHCVFDDAAMNRGIVSES